MHFGCSKLALAKEKSIIWFIKYLENNKRMIESSI